MSKIKYDEIQVGDLVEMEFQYIDKPNCLGYVTNVNHDKREVTASWSDTFREEPVYQTHCYDPIVGHWKVINFEEETEVDELKVYTGKDTIEALLEGKTLKRLYSGCNYKLESNKLTYEYSGKWISSDLGVDTLLSEEFTEVATPQVGAWVRVTMEGPIKTYKFTSQVNKLEGSKMWADWEEEGKDTYFDINSKGITWEILSPEQIAEYKREQVFAKVGRKPNEYRENDIVFLENTGTICMVTTKSNFNGNVGVKEINKPQKWNALVKQLEPIAFAENLISLS